jgi:thiopeptide-type bacteriocin biosynthesis protein
MTTTELAMPHHTEGRWTSAHLFFAGAPMGPSGDQVLRSVVRPFVTEMLSSGQVSRSFFIRYGELGPHIRLRLFGEPEVLARVVEPAFERHVSHALHHSLHGHPNAKGPPGTRETGLDSLLWVPYEPEIGRYGGPRCISVVEEFFHNSSALALALLGDHPLVNQSQRLGLGLAAMLCLYAGFLGSPGGIAALASTHRDQFAGASGPNANTPIGAAFSEGYERQADQVGRQIDHVWQVLAHEGDVGEPLAAYLRAARALRASVNVLLDTRTLIDNDLVVADIEGAAQLLLPSLVHMTSNRLGLAPIQEAFLSSLIAMRFAMREGGDGNTGAQE